MGEGVLIRSPLEEGGFFGYEFEFNRSVGQHCLKDAVISAYQGSGVDPLVRTTGWEHNHDNEEWVIKTDSSCGWEISSPRLCGLDQCHLAARVLDYCEMMGARIDKNCGVHIHFSSSNRQNMDLVRLVRWWIKMEWVIFACIPRDRRTNPYSPSLTKYGRLLADHDYGNEDLLRLFGETRYLALNLRNHLSGKPKVEVRVIEGLLSGTELANYTQFFGQVIRQAWESGQPKDLTWFELKSAMEWVNWINVPEKGIVNRYAPEIQEARLWLARRVVKNMSHKHKRAGKLYDGAMDVLKGIESGRL